MTTTQNTIECPCGLRVENNATVVWVRSPRTGRELIFTERVQSGLPAGVKARIVQTAATGKHVAEFTPEELHKLVALEKEAREALTPRKLIGGGRWFGGRGHW